LYFSILKLIIILFSYKLFRLIFLVSYIELRLEGNWEMTGLLKNGDDYLATYQNRPVSDSLSVIESYITSPTIRDNIPAMFYFYTNTHSILSTLSFSPKTNLLACYFFNYQSFNAHFTKPLSNTTIETVELITGGITSYKYYA